MVRSLVLLIILSGLAWWLRGEQSHSRFRQVNETFLDFLLANTRDDLKPDPAKMQNVVFVRMDEAERKEYSAWPPAPIDYQMIFKGLAVHEPAVLVVASPLAWPEPKPDLIPQVAQSMLTLPSVVIAAGAVPGTNASASSPFVRERLPLITAIQGTLDLMPWLQSIDQEPEPDFARQCDAGVIVSQKHLIALRIAGGCVPSLEMQTLAHAARVPFDQMRLVLGPGAGLHLSDELFVPLESDGSLRNTAARVPMVNALELMTSSVADADPEVVKTLGKGKVIVLGLADETTTVRAANIAEALALPRVRVLSVVSQYTAWALTAALMLCLLWLPKAKAIVRSLICLFALLTASYLAFQATKMWCPPAIPAALIIAGGLFARIFGRA